MNANVKRPRLPGLPFAGYEPPDTLPTAPERVAQQLEQDKGQEAYVNTFLVPSIAGANSVPKEYSVYKTFAPWRACDVYVSTEAPPGGFAFAGTLSVFVYALVGGTRTLVASGRYEAGGPGPFRTRWLAAARSVAQRFEVTVVYTQPTVIAASVISATVAVVASNDATEVPDDLGVGVEQGNVVYLNTVLTSVNISALTTQVPPALELFSVRAVNGAAAARFLQLHDTALLVPAAGAAPLMVWPLGAAIGAGLPETRVRGFRAKFRPILLVSSTMNTLTAVADCSVTAQFR